MKSRQKVKSKNLSSELLSEQSPELLKELHLLTSDGNLNADARRKLKQVNHLVQLIKPALTDLQSRHEKINVVDVGAGKAYLGFILYELFFKSNENGVMTSIESREELMQKAKNTAAKLKYENMKFVNGKINGSFFPERAHLLTALHACDTATDDAIIAGVNAHVDYMALVPCCQAEVAQLLKELPKTLKNAELWQHGIHRREFGSHLTNVIRCLLLESFGYQVTVTELVGWEHSLKNEFIFAKKINRENLDARKKLKEILTNIPIRPKAVQILFKDL